MEPMCEEFEVISHGNMDYNIFLNNLLYRTPHVHKEFEVCLLLDGSVPVSYTHLTLPTTERV